MGPYDEDMAKKQRNTQGFENWAHRVVKCADYESEHFSLESWLLSKKNDIKWSCKIGIFLPGFDQMYLIYFMLIKHATYKIQVVWFCI